MNDLIERINKLEKEHKAGFTPQFLQLIEILKELALRVKEFEPEPINEEEIMEQVDGRRDSTHSI